MFKNKIYREKIDRSVFLKWVETHYQEVEFILHIGARTDTTEFDIRIFDELNLNYSKSIWDICVKYNIPLIYASSAATYGMGEWGYNDDHDIIEKLKPLNPYGESKNEFDKWALKQTRQPYFWAGLKFFNVFGPNENHKERMASVIFQAFNTISETGHMGLFRSNHPEIEDGEQARDFIYVEDVSKVILFFMNHRKDSGIYNVGTGEARTYLSLTRAVFRSMKLEENIGFIDTPDDLRGKYQYYTCANIQKLRKIGYTEPFSTLEDGIDDYVTNYLIPRARY